MYRVETKNVVRGYYDTLESAKKKAASYKIQTTIWVENEINGKVVWVLYV